MQASRRLCHLLAWSLLIAAATDLAGCSRGLKEGLYAVTGAGGKATLIQGDQDQLRTVAYRFGSARVEPFENEVGAICPDEFLTALPPAIEEQLRYRPRSLGSKVKGVTGKLTGSEEQPEEPFFSGPAESALIIRGRVIQYDSGSVQDKILGPLDEAICRTEFVDSRTGEVYAQANLTGRVKSSVRTGPQELAAGVAKALRDLLKPADD